MNTYTSKHFNIEATYDADEAFEQSKRARQHSPGPWSVGSNGLTTEWARVTKAGRTTLHIQNDGRITAAPDDTGTPTAVADLTAYRSDEETTANLHLIASASELLKALLVLTLTEKTVEWLAENDPQALIQARAAVESALPPKIK